MSQISPPIRIVLVAAVVFLAAWFTVLKPKDEVVAGPAPAAPAATPAAAASPATPASAAGKYQAKAQAGKAAAEQDATGAANANIEGDAPAAAPSATAPGATATTAPGATKTAKPAAPALPALSPAQVKGLSAAVRRGLEHRRVVVLGVVDTVSKPWAPMADDDRAVASALRRVNRYRGDVVVATAPIARLAKYRGLLQALDVTQSPTVVVVDRDRHGTALTGYVDRAAINQAVVDARRAAPRPVRATFLRRTNEVCGRYAMRMDRLGVRGSGVQRADFRRALSGIASTYTRAFAAVPAAGPYRALRGRIVAGVRADVARTRAAGRAPVRGVLLPLSGELNRAGLTNCTGIRTQ